MTKLFLVFKLLIQRLSELGTQSLGLGTVSRVLTVVLGEGPGAK